jgi:hypothetical protein
MVTEIRTQGITASATKRRSDDGSSVSCSRLASGPATFHIPEEALQNGIEIARAFPERRVLEPGKAMTVAFPQIGIGKRVEVIELDEAILAAVDHRKPSVPPARVQSRRLV